VRSRTLVLAALAVLVAVPEARAASVHVRVEGKTRTLYGATEPTLQGGNALEAIESASLAGELYYHVTTTSFGPYVDQVGRYGGSASSGWVFKVNGASPPVGADKVQLKDGDTVLWYYADFGQSGGPPTLRLRSTGKGCYAVTAQNDNGQVVAQAGIVLHVGSKRTVKVAAGKACVGAHPGALVRATAPGAVRSNALA
jgi:hypothetical protein